MGLEFIYDNLAFFLFVIFIAVFVTIKKKNLELQGSFPQFFILMYKTKLGLDKMDKWSKSHPKTFLYLGYLAYFIGVFGLIFSFLFMMWQLWFIYDQNISSGAAGLVLPVKTESGLDSAVPVFYVPFVYWIIGLFLLVVVHEFAHGVIAKRFGIRVKSSGFAFFGSAFLVLLFLIIILGQSYTISDLFALNGDLIFALILGIIFMFIPFMPAAFVEPDDKQMAKKKPWQQIAVLGAGSTSNFLFGFLFLFLWIFVAAPLYSNTVELNGVSFAGVMNESSLADYGIENGTIVAYNGNEDLTELFTHIQSREIGDQIDLTIDDGGTIDTYTITTFENPNSAGKSMVGIMSLSLDTAPVEGKEFLNKFAFQFERILFWLWLLNIGIGIMNLLPLWITDGGQVLRVLMMQRTKNMKTVMKTLNFFSLLSLIMIIFLMWPSLFFRILGLF